MVELVADNCDPAAYVGDQLYFNKREDDGLTNPYVGNLDGVGVPLLELYDGHRGVEDVSDDGQFVLYVKAVGGTKQASYAQQGQGINNVLKVYDQVNGTTYDLMPDSDAGGTSPKRLAVMWADFNEDLTKVSWTQAYKLPWFSAGLWEVRCADLTPDFQMVNERVWHPSVDAFSEAYGWVPGTDRIIFASNDGTGGGMLAAKLWTIDADLMTDKQPVVPLADAKGYYEFATFTEAHHLLSSRTYKSGKGGLELWDLTTNTRLTYFNGDKGPWGEVIPVEGWLTPVYKNVLGAPCEGPDGLYIGTSGSVDTKLISMYRLT
jgi:hypothetical protein